ncbi:hypothetical protein B0H13DRAFT_778854 [Mycena leptocephala]|nr:hypothetical protein B0H13DRAFT_778854 [Mycena leptocephala]
MDDSAAAQKQLSPAEQRQGPSALHETQVISQIEQPQICRDLSKSRPKPRSPPVPSKSHALTSQQLTPTTALTSPTTAASAPPPDLASFGSFAQPAVMEEAALIPMSAKARGKQKVSSEDVVRTPSPGQADAWIQSSGNGGRRSLSRGRRSTSRRTSASRGRGDPALHSPLEDMSHYFNGLDPSPTRMQTSGLKISPQSLHYYPIAPAIPSPISTPFVHLSGPQLPTPELYPQFDSQPYGDGTIDPSLLGGGMMDPDVPDSYEPGMVDSYELDEESQMGSPSPSVASSSSYEHAVSPPAPHRSGRRPVQRRIPADMVRTDLLPSDDSASTSSSDYFSSPSPKPTPKPKRTAMRRRIVSSGETLSGDGSPSPSPKRTSKPTVKRRIVKGDETKRPPLASR